MMSIKRNTSQVKSSQNKVKIEIEIEIDENMKESNSFHPIHN